MLKMFPPAFTNSSVLLILSVCSSFTSWNRHALHCFRTLRLHEHIHKLSFVVTMLEIKFLLIVLLTKQTCSSNRLMTVYKVGGSCYMRCLCCFISLLFQILPERV